MVGTVIWVLLGLVFQDGQPQGAIVAYPTEKACQVAAAAATDSLVSNHINQGSVQCVKVVIGEFA